MELWTRSHDKERLEKSTGFHILMASENEFDIVNSYMTIMGRYKTKERALEVLDEIQNMIKPTTIITEYHSEIKQGIDKSSFDVIMQPVEDKITYIQPNIVIYEMPEK